MNERVPTEILEDKLSEEFVRRGVSGCFFFVLMSGLLMYIDWVPQSENLHTRVDTLLGLVLLTNIGRFWILNNIVKGNKTAFFQTGAKIFALINPVLWAAIFSQVIWFDKFQTSCSLLVILLTAGFSVGATMTLSANQTVIFIYQIILQFPIIWGGINLVIDQGSGQSFLIAISILIFFGYNIFQAITIRKQLIYTISSIYFLEESKKDLEESQRKLKEESAKVVHSSRLASLGEMAGGVAHEINNPLAILTLNHSSLNKTLLKYKDQLEESVFSKLDKISRSTNRINTIVSGLRNFSQHGDQLPLEETTIDRIFKDSLEFCNEKIKAKNIEFKVTGDLSIKIQARPVQISQIILNLLNNAVYAVKDSKNPKIILDVTRHNNTVYIEVSDSGPGVPDSVKQKLFQPFVTTKEVGSGTGLGLSVSRGLAREHKGDLLLLDDVQQTTFRLELPISHTTNKEAAA